MKQRQVLRQLAEAGQLRLQDFDAAGLVRLLREELITVTGQTVTLTDKGRRLAAPKKPTVQAGKPLHPLRRPTCAASPCGKHLVVHRAVVLRRAEA
jgi:hypothetical protein